MKDQSQNLDVRSYSLTALPHLQTVLNHNLSVLNQIAERLVSDVEANRCLFVFGSGHSALLPLEIYHRAGGPSFVIPLVADYLLPHAGPKLVRLMERTAGAANLLLDRAQIQQGEMVWIASQSGINAAVIEFALEAKKRGLRTVAFTSLVHSRSVPSRHPSKQRLFEVCDDSVDLGGCPGDASVAIAPGLSAGPLSTLTSTFLAHSILTFALGQLERKGVRCTYTSVNTPEGEIRNAELEKKAVIRDPLLR